MHSFILFCLFKNNLQCSFHIEWIFCMFPLKKKQKQERIKAEDLRKQNIYQHYWVCMCVCVCDPQKVIEKKREKSFRNRCFTVTVRVYIFTFLLFNALDFLFCLVYFPARICLQVTNDIKHSQLVSFRFQFKLLWPMRELDWMELSIHDSGWFLTGVYQLKT